MKSSFRTLTSTFVVVLLSLAVAGSQVFADLLDDEDEKPAPSIPQQPLPPQDQPVSPPPTKASGAKPAPHKSPAKSPAKPVRSPAGKKSDQREPVLFESRGLKGLREQGMVELMDDVVVTQADLRVEADQAKVYFDEQHNDVTRVVAVGNVKIFKTDEETGERIKAFSDEVTFNNGDRTIVMEGNARLWRGADLVRGKKITYEMDSGWIKADRVAGEVHPEEAPKASGRKR